MKQFLSLLFIIATCISSTKAQVKITEAIREVKPLDVPSFSNDILDIEVFERPNYTGKSGRFKMENGKLVSPFKFLDKVSFKVSPGKIVYIKKCDTEFPYENAYAESQTSADLRHICGIRSDKAANLPIQFNGLSTVIHNNDCRRVFGNVRIKIFEIAPDGSTQSFMRHSTASAFPGPDQFTFQPFTHPNSSTQSRLRDLLANETPAVPSISTIVASSSGLLAIGNFKIGASALTQGRLWVMVTSDIGSAHKTCDLCDDFSSNVRMAAPVTETFPLNKLYGGSKIVNAANSKVVLGPYKAKGQRDGVAITASGGTFIDFRVHLTVAGL